MDKKKEMQADQIGSGIYNALQRMGHSELAERFMIELRSEQFKQQLLEHNMKKGKYEYETASSTNTTKKNEED